MLFLMLLVFAGSDIDLNLMSNWNDEYVPIIIHMIDQANPETIKSLNSYHDKISYLKSFAANDQTELLVELQTMVNDVQDVQSFWIFNGIALKAKPTVIEYLQTHNEIAYINYDHFIMSEQFIESQRTPEWNISRIKADSCWVAGYTGTGTVIGIVDTGADTSHVALRGKWIIGGWYDAVNGLPGPYDDNGHGTQVLGIALGGDGQGPNADDIGVAPDANFIAAKGFNAGGSGQLSWLHNCLQWIALQAPDVVIGAWGMTGTSTEFWDDCVNLRAIGIAPVFPVGSGGPSPGTTAAPGNYPTVFGVGATDNNDNIASFSARGPAPNQYPWNDTTFWSRPDWNLTKPDISAPGVNIRTCGLGGGYIILSGTSFSCAHVGGAVALLLSRDTSAVYETLYNLLLDYADEPPQGSPYPNNSYGWGRLNVYAAIQQLGIKRQTMINPESKVLLIPNPFTRHSGIKFIVPHSDGNSEIAIYDDLGALVRRIEILQLDNDVSKKLFWDGKDQNNQYVPSGIYFVVIKTKQERAIEKIIFLY